MKRRWPSWPSAGRRTSARTPATTWPTSRGLRSGLPGLRRPHAVLHAARAQAVPRTSRSVRACRRTTRRSPARATPTSGAPLQITCVEPYPFDALSDAAGLRAGRRASCRTFRCRGSRRSAAGDVLFIDSSHALKIDSDVAYLFLEVLPRLKPGVLVHIHDVPFPYNVPYPARHVAVRRAVAGVLERGDGRADVPRVQLRVRDPAVDAADPARRRAFLLDGSPTTCRWLTIPTRRRRCGCGGWVSFQILSRF